MNEDEYRIFYTHLNQQPCIFEKITLLRYAGCQYCQKIFIAEREGMSCQSRPAQKNCLITLSEIRKKARFSLQVTQANEPLPHSKELKVQAGGLYGLQQYVNGKDPTDIQELNDDNRRFESNNNRPILNIHQTITEAFVKFGSISEFPFNEIIKTINLFTIRRRKKKKKDP